MKKYQLKPHKPAEPKEKPCFYCDKKRFAHSPEADEWILKNAPICAECRRSLELRCGAEISKQPVESKQDREPGSDDN